MSYYLRALPVVLILAISSVNSPAHAQKISPWIGKKVVTKYQTPLKVGGQVVDKGDAFRVYTVEQVNDGWLWLASGSVKGWATASEVIPFDQAIDFYTKEIRANPRKASAYVWRGLVWNEKGEKDIAIADYSEAIKLDRSNSAAFNNRGNAWRDKQEYDKAIDDYSEAIRLDPKRTSAYDDRGNAWFDQGKYDKAIADYDEAMRLDPDNATRHNERGVSWGNLKNYEKAIADYNEAIRLDPKSPWPFSNRGWAWHNKREYGKAIADYNEAIRLDPKCAVPFNLRAWLLATCPDAKLRDGQRAVESATRAFELSEWKVADNLGTLAAAYAQAGRFDKAVEWEEKATKLYIDPEDKKKGEERMKLYKDKKPYREAE